VPGVTTVSASAEGVPYEGALIAVKVYSPDFGSWMESDYSDPAGNVTFTVPDFTGNVDVYITATEFNMAPYLYQSVTAIDENSSAAVSDGASLRLSSTPCTGALSIFCSVPPGVSADIEIFDITGRIVRKIPLENPAGETQTVWDREAEVPDGIYYCMLRAGADTIVKPVLMLE